MTTTSCTGNSTKMGRFFTLLLLIGVLSVRATKKQVDRVLDPTDETERIFIESQELQSPGLISLENLYFMTIDSTYYNAGGDDDANNNGDDDGSYVGAMVDIAIVYCGPLEDATECDLEELGVGMEDDYGVYHQCCDEDALTAGICGEEGRLLLDYDVFSGKLIELELYDGDEATVVDNPRYSKRIPGLYIVIAANCYPYSSSVSMTGELVFKSRYGYLPVRMWKFLWVSHVFTLICLAVAVWFYQLRRRQTIDIIIQITLILAFLESLFTSMYYIRYNRSGESPSSLNALCLLVDGLKCGIGHVLIILAAFGWGHFDAKFTENTPIHNLCLLGVFYTIIQVIPSLNHPAAVGEVIGLFFVVWGVKVTSTTIEKLRRKRGERFRRYVLYRGLLIGLLFLALVLFSIFVHMTRKAQYGDRVERIRQRFLVIRQVVFVIVVVCISHLVRPYDESFVEGGQAELVDNDKTVAAGATATAKNGQLA